MLRHAVHSAAMPNPFASAPCVAALGLQVRNGRCSKPSFYGANATRQKAAFGRASTAGVQSVTSAHSGCFRLVSRPLSGVTLRACPAPGGSSLFCFAFTTPSRKERALWTPDSAPSGLRFPPAADPP